MMDFTPDRWEQRLHETAQAFSYPATPDLSRQARRALDRPSRPARRKARLAWALAAILTALALLLSVPPVRAAILEFIQIGAVRIFLAAPTTTPTAPPVTSGPLASPASPTPPLPALLAGVAGETTLEAARQQVSFPIRLPAYPAGLGPPDRVYVQDQGDGVAILVWLDPDQHNRVRLSLHIIGPDSWAVKKIEPDVIEQTRVNGQPAVWTQGPYLLLQRDGEVVLERLIVGHVLIWAEGDLTYRLETDLPLEEAVRMAESLEP